MECIVFAYNEMANRNLYNERALFLGELQTLDESTYQQLVNDDNFISKPLNEQIRYLDDLITQLYASMDEAQQQPKSSLVQTKHNMTQRQPKSAIPDWDNDFESLNALRAEHRQSIRDSNIATKDYKNVLQRSAFFKQNMPANLVKKKKENKYGLNQGAMSDLINIVSKMKQDIKQIKDAQSVESANRWIQRHNYGGLYDAVNRDLDGDSFPEVVVQTKDGRPVIINGYTTVDSTFPYRNHYYHNFPSKEARKNAKITEGINGPRDFAYKSLYNPVYDAAGRKLMRTGSQNLQEFEARMAKSGYTKKLAPHNRSTYQAFVSKCVTPIFKALQWYNRTRDIVFGNQRLSLTELASTIWNQTVLNAAMHEVYPDLDTQNMSDSDWKLLRGKKEVKQAVDIIVIPILTSVNKSVDLVNAALEYLYRKLGVQGITDDDILNVKMITEMFLLGLPPKVPRVPSNKIEDITPQVVALYNNQQYRDMKEDAVKFFEEGEYDERDGRPDAGMFMRGHNFEEENANINEGEDFN